MHCFSMITAGTLCRCGRHYFFFTNRTRCPEMTDPQCPVCPVQDVCARRTSLFQPVFRTEAY
jgi:hypothetical protein